MAANVPDLYICLSIDRDASDFVNLGWLKSNTVIKILIYLRE